MRAACAARRAIVNPRGPVCVGGNPGGVVTLPLICSERSTNKKSSDNAAVFTLLCGRLESNTERGYGSAQTKFKYTKGNPTVNRLIVDALFLRTTRN